MSKKWVGWETGGPPTKLLHDEKIYSKPLDIANIINAFFVDKVHYLRQNLPPAKDCPLGLTIN